MGRNRPPKCRLKQSDCHNTLNAVGLRKLEARKQEISKTSFSGQTQAFTTLNIQLSPRLLQFNPRHKANTHETSCEHLPRPHGGWRSFAILRSSNYLRAACAPIFV